MWKQVRTGKESAEEEGIMIRESVRYPGDFDENGLLKAPVLFWMGLIVLARAIHHRVE
ncbi:DUF2919 family protein [Salmonella enterica]|nr:DUF2919 family protein [Salmonella enterica]